MSLDSPRSFNSPLHHRKDRKISRRNSTARRALFRPLVEQLEDRRLLTQVFLIGDDSGGDKAFEFTQSGAFVNRFATPFSSRSIAEKGDGFLYVAGISEVTKFSTAGISQGTFVNVSSVPGWTGGISTIEFGSNGNLFVSSAGSSSQPRKSAAFNAAGTHIATYEDPLLVFPDGMDVDGSGNVWIVNGAAVGVGNELFKFSSTGTKLGQFDIDGQVGNPSDLAIDEAVGQPAQPVALGRGRGCGEGRRRGRGGDCLVHDPA